MAHELENTFAEIDKAGHSEEKQLGNVYQDVVKLYQADRANPDKLKSDLSAVNAKLLSEGLLGNITITDFQSEKNDHTGSSMQLKKADGSILSFDESDRLTAIQYPDKSSKYFAYRGDTYEITKETLTKPDGTVDETFTKNADTTWTDSKGKKLTDAQGNVQSIDLRVTADGIVLKKTRSDSGTKFDATNSDGSVNKEIRDFYDAENYSLAVEAPLPETLSGTDAAKLLQNISPDLLAQMTDSAGLIEKSKLQDLVSKSLVQGEDNIKTIKTLLSAFNSMSKDGLTIDPDFVARSTGLELATTQASKYNLYKFITQDQELAKQIQTADGKGIDLAKVAKLAGAQPGSAESQFLTPERKDVLKQLLDSSGMLAKAETTVIPMSELSSGARAEADFRKDLLSYLADSAGVKAQITDEKGLIDEAKLNDYVKSRNNKADHSLVQLAAEFKAYAIGGKLDLETLSVNTGAD